jgi:hypothetical protein
VLVRPRRSLLRAGIAGVLVGGAPLFAVLYWLSFSQGNWRRVLLAQIVVLVACGVLLLRFRAGFVRVDPEFITKQSFFRRIVVRRSDVAAILIVETYRDSSTETRPQFLAIAADLQPLLRLRGIYWTRADMLAIATAIGVSTTVEPGAMTLREFYALHPGIAYWYEGRPWVGVVGILVAFIASAFALGWLMTATGMSAFLLAG